MSGQLKTLYLIRHGAVACAASLLGRSDIPLSAAGRLSVADLIQAMSVAHRCRAIFSSPLMRCRESAEQFASLTGLGVQVMNELAECDFGALDGVPFVDYSTSQQRMLSLFWSDPMQVLPKAEPLPDFYHRTNNALQTLWPQIDGEAMVFTHGGVIRMLLAEVLQLGLGSVKSLLSMHIPYASVTEIQCYSDPDSVAQFSVRRIGWQPQFC